MVGKLDERIEEFSGDERDEAVGDGRDDAQEDQDDQALFERPQQPKDGFDAFPGLAFLFSSFFMGIACTS